MLESLVSSRIRRTLLEHLLAHPQDRFYLRGLARQLGLTISPLRRELKRFERLGMLSIAEEANAKFYMVNQTPPAFTQLQSATRTQPVESQPTIIGRVMEQAAPLAEPVAVRQPPAVAFPKWSAVLLTAVSVSMALIAIVGVIAYLVMTNQQLIAMAKQAIGNPHAPMAMVKGAPNASGQLSGGHWRLLPGTFGGFNAAEPQQESY